MNDMKDWAPSVAAAAASTSYEDYLRRLHGEPQPLAPLGATDMYGFANGVLVSYGEGVMRFYADASTQPVIVPAKSWPVIVAVAQALGLSDTEGALLAEAAEAFA